MVTGGVGAVAGWLGAEFYLNSKYLSFDSKILDLTRNDIMKGGTGAGLGSMGDVGLSTGAALGGSTLKERHMLKMLESGEYPLQKFIWNIGGRGMFALGVAVAAGAAVAGVYLATHPKKAEELENAGPTPDEIRGIMKDAVRETGTGDFIRQYSVTKDPEERQKLRDSWEHKMAERQAARLHNPQER